MFDDLFEDVASLGGAVFGGKLGSDTGKTIASDISGGDRNSYCFREHYRRFTWSLCWARVC